MILSARGHTDYNRFGVAADVNPIFETAAGGGEAIERGANRHGHGARSAEAGAGGRFGICGEREAGGGAEKSHQMREKRKPIAARPAQGFERREGFLAARVGGNEGDAALTFGAGFDNARSVAGDRAIHGERAFVKEVKRPNVERAAGQIDARRSTRFNSHFD